ncbi:MAG TPA: NAD(P)/FAD-dependent oxidoreductase [Flavisolibacter sp.]|nr:NAD(P)/FAD-dependent oxidoreductase [Flavisolibacter sp.]
MRRRLVVIGGGAAGFFCAVNAARMDRHLDVVLLEKTNKLLSKVRISGGGRCNLTHALFDIAEMSKRYPRGQNFVKKTFHQFFTADTISWFEERGVRVKSEKDGRMFPVSDDSSTIIECLLKEAQRYGVKIMMNAEVREIQANGEQFQLHVMGRELQEADFICIACGGYPKAAMFHWLLQLGHTIAHPVPSLFTFNLPKHPITQLMGVSVENARVKIESSKLLEEGPVLITHWGLSGPAVLRLSAWGARELAALQYNFNVHINWLPDKTEQDLKARFQQMRKTNAGKKLSNHNLENLPARLWHFLLQASGADDVRFADLPAKTENILIQNLVDYKVEVRGKTSFKEEFVTAGGITLSEVDSNTMMSKKHPNLFFAGEILDVDGITGGFNFQHAWTSGWIAATSIASISQQGQK